MNFLAILVSAAAGMAVGFFWFGPIFGKAWVSLAGITEAQMNEAKEKGMNRTYAYAFLAVFLMAYGLSLLVSGMDMEEALRIGFIGWLALIVPTMANGVLWEGRPKKLFYINIAERLVTILVMSAILSAW